MRLDKKIFVLGLFFFIVMTISGIYSLSNTVDSIDNTLSTAYVDIDLVATEGDYFVMPGDTVSLNPKVNNIGVDCYVRFKMTYLVNGVESNNNDLSIMINSDWVKRGEYYYYRNVLKRNENVLLFDTLSFPTTLDNRFAYSKFTVKLVAEAIQEANFNQDLNSNSPWGDVPIKKKIERNYSLDTEGTQTIIYENNSDRYLTVDSKFFNGLMNLIPGDVKTDFIDVSNTGDNDFKLYFKVSSNYQTQSEKELLESIKLTITDSSNKTLYNGPLLTNEKNYLSHYDKGARDKLTLTISVPKELDNEHGGLLSNIGWTLSCEEDEVIPVPKTGDQKLDVSIKVFIFSFIGFIAMLIMWDINNKDRKKLIKKREEN